MTTPFDSLPEELQQSVREMRAANMDESFVDSFIQRMLHALGVKSNRVQVEVWEMEERLGRQLEGIGHKLQVDLQTQHGATNGMLIELRQAQQTAHPQIGEALAGIADIKKNWQELNTWRGRVEATLLAFSEFRENSTADRRSIRDVVAQQDARHGGQIGEMIEQLRAFATELGSFGQRLEAIEALLEVAGQHEAGS